MRDYTEFQHQELDREYAAILNDVNDQAVHRDALVLNVLAMKPAPAPTAFSELLEAA